MADNDGSEVAVILFKWLKIYKEEGNHNQNHCGCLEIHGTLSVGTNKHHAEAREEKEGSKPSTVTSPWLCPIFVASIERVQKGV